ncbi:hypothetical protein VKT23_000758 [Stygiomarasmius scandens]|uniref:Uncharacterized protein n=1 Tax=Marasmiellus scandens TaxID=2682957 RepID=A0ABR1K7G5_9AGAR
MSTPFPGPPSEPIPPLPSPDSACSKPLVHHSSSMVHLASEIGDPRKARRQCTDFGFRRPSIPCSVSDSPSDCSLATSSATPPGTFTSSDSDASSIEDLQYDFPQPPPISPVLRRMKSSPLFTLDDTDPHTNRKRWGAMVIRKDEGPTSQLYKSHGVADSLSDLDIDMSVSSHFDTSRHGKIDRLSKELDLEDEGESLIMQAPRQFRHPPIASPLSSVIATSSSCLSHNVRSLTLKDDDPSSHSRPAKPRRISKMRSLKFSPESTESLERLEVTMEKPRQPKSLFRGRSISMNFLVPHPSSNLPRPHCSQQALSVRPQATNRDKDTPSGLATPFLRRQTHAAPPSSNHRAHALSSSGMRSFIDITPDQEVRRGSIIHKDRMKKLLARASSVFDWGKALKKKSSFANFSG